MTRLRMVLTFQVEPATPTEPLLMKEPMLQDYRQDAMKNRLGNRWCGSRSGDFMGRKLENRVTNIRSTWIDENHIVHVGVIDGLEPNQTVRYQVPVQGFGSF